MKKFLDVYILKPFGELTTKKRIRRYIYRFLTYLIPIVLLILIILMSSCGGKFERKVELRSKYFPFIYPEDTVIQGVVKSIAYEKVKRMGDLFFSNSNNVLIQSDTTNFSVCVDKITFNVNDSVKVVVERVKQKGDFNDIKTTIYPTFGESTYTYWTFTNLYWKEVYFDELEKIE